MAFLVFLFRTAGARIVAADFGFAADDGFDFAGLFVGSGGTLVRASKLKRPTTARGEAAALDFKRPFGG